MKFHHFKEGSKISSCGKVKAKKGDEEYPDQKLPPKVDRCKSCEKARKR